jgi:putative YphP/YqiW family bacilliredoxin
MYDERFVTPMRQELTRLGVEELRTAAEVDAKLKDSRGTTLVVVNSVCGCAARNARPAVARALQNAVVPDARTTVFAGQDREATERARSYFTGYPPSSPQIALMKDGNVVFMLERYQIEGRSADEIARDLVGAFDRYCGAAVEGSGPSREQKGQQPQKAQLPQAAVPSPS